MKVGEKYGKLTCIGKDETRDSRYYLFKCECGNIKSIIQDNVKSGATRSCGCLMKTHPNHVTFGFSHTRIDNIYKAMVDRCNNPNCISYKNYGAKGIKVCDEWENDKLKFFEWAFANGYKKTLTLDRIDNFKGYSPENCRWVTYKEQGRNKRNTVFLTAFGETKPLMEWSEIVGISHNTIRGRIKK